jgi:purine-binding chemotaxis protein CheW
MNEMESDALLRAMHEAREQLDAGNVDKRSRNRGERCIAFRVCDERYAIELLVVREVITPPTIVAVPGAPCEVLGVINLRGNVVTVINSRRTLGLEGVASGVAARVLVIEDEGQEVGVLVDSVDDIVHVQMDRLGETRHGSEPGSAAKFRGTVMLGEDIAFLLHRSALTSRAA